ncbi:MAG: hypothetical protein WDZ35_11215 [Crocinitomicaceae bacterium]
MNVQKSAAPFEYMVLDIKVCGTDARTGKTAVLILFMDWQTGIVFHNLYTTQTGKGVLVKFLRYISNKYNFGDLKVSYKLITAFEKPFETVIKMFLKDASEIIFDPELANAIAEQVRGKFVNMQ